MFKLVSDSVSVWRDRRDPREPKGKTWGWGMESLPGAILENHRSLRMYSGFLEAGIFSLKLIYMYA